MDPDKLKSLQINPAAKRRTSRSLGFMLLVMVLLTSVAAYFAFLRPEAAQRLLKSATATPLANESAPSAAATHTSPPQPDDVVLTVSGYIVNRERIELSPRFMGVVNWIGVKKGDTVTNGQVVVVLDDAEYRARLREAEGRLESARVAVTKAELDYERIQKLIADNIETRQNADDYRLRVEAARASRKEIEGQVALMQTYLDWTVIRSPVNGVVLEKLVDGGELVTPQSFGGARGPSTAVVAIANPRDLQVEVDLNEADVAKVSLGQRCRVSPEAYPDKGYGAYVAELAPEANRQKGTLQIKVQIENPDSYLTPELRAKVDFLNAPRPSAAHAP